MPKPLKEPDYGDDDLPRVQLQLWGALLKLLNHIAEDRNIPRSHLMYIIFRDWLKEQGYGKRIDPKYFEPPGFGPDQGTTYNK